MVEMKYSSSKELCKKYDGKIQQGMKKVAMSKYGLSDAWYGGFLNSVCELKNNPVLILVDKDNNTLAVAYKVKDENKLSKEDRVLFGLAPVETKAKK